MCACIWGFGCLNAPSPEIFQEKQNCTSFRMQFTGGEAIEMIFEQQKLQNGQKFIVL